MTRAPVPRPHRSEWYGNPLNVRWTAGPDGIAHAYTPFGRSRSLCDWPRLPPCMHHPGRERCASCERACGLLPLGAPAPEDRR